MAVSPVITQKPLIIAIDSLDYKTAAVQAKLIAKRLSGDNLKIVVLDFMSPDAQPFLVYNRFERGLYGNAEAISPHKLVQLIGPEYLKTIESGAILKNKAPLVIFSGYAGMLMLNQAGGLGPQHMRFGYYTWCDSYLFDQLGLPKPDLNIVISTGSSDEQFIDELTRLMPKNFARTSFADPHSGLSIANLNNQLLGILKNYLNNLDKVGRDLRTLSQKALELIRLNFELAKKLDAKFAKTLLPIADLKTNQKIRSKIIIGDTDIAQTGPWLKLYDYQPKNELSLASTHPGASYEQKYQKLSRLIANSPGKIKASYTVEVRAEFSLLAGIIGRRVDAVDYIKIAKQFPIQDGDEEADFYRRYNTVINFISKSLPVEEMVLLLASGCPSVCRLKTDYRGLQALSKKLNKSGFIGKKLQNDLKNEMELTHTLIGSSL